MNIRTGHFGLISQLDAIAAAGYDSAELHVWEIMNFDNAQYAIALQKVRDCGIPCCVFNNPLPMDIRINDDSFVFTYYKEYMKRAVDRMAKMGARYVNFGNGRTRRIPEDGDMAEAVGRNMEVIGMLCDLAAEANITVMLEPIGTTITNFVTTISEAYMYVQRLGKSNLKTMVDYRWFINVEGYSYAELEKYAKFVVHAHIDYPLSILPQRIDPTVSDGHDYSHYFEALERMDYDGILSIETNFHPNFEQDIRSGMALLNKYGVPSISR